MDKEKIYVFGCGYQGRTLELLIGTLVDNGIEMVIDVRSYASSWHRPELSKNNLSSSLRSAGIAYEHAGRSVGGKIKNVGFSAKIDQLSDMARRGNRMCLLCLESDETQCHRTSKLKPAFARRGVELVELVFAE